ncbi:ABC transporter substrate-binding protein [Microlunatus soli]|uniref:Amino acid ABC transporter substrate-binding protein, PAAT family n=1 Tax=Microlunatus soli TaxID=630515 RepID=A0A1H1S253_9ACTN|nr:ABC transporter substrate-binding protein [Microlunatus soli]SDS42051.1 amino acid ABC transporter substrate-binding protein, PAAT family [Microlunatus soli]
MPVDRVPLTSTVRRLLAAGLALAALGVTACSQTDGGLQASPAPSGADCTVAKLPLKNPGRFTVATDEPAYEPWFSDDNPNNGKGFESAVTFAVAKELGFAAEQVDWVQLPFNSAIAPGEKSFDIDINQVTITPQRRQNVDLSAPYFATSQAVVTLEGGKLAGISSMAELRGGKLGAQADSTSLAAITDQVKPQVDPEVLDTNAAGIKALEDKRIDGLVVDLPTAYQMTSGQVDGGLLVGRLPAAGGKLEQFGMVLDQGSKLTPCINQTINKLQDNGTLAGLEGKWIDLPDVPELK